MGAVLEMRARISISVLLVALSVLISGCSSTKDKVQADADAAPLFQMVKGFAGIFKKSGSAVDPRKMITRKAIDASPVDVLLAGIEVRDAFATLSPIGENAGVVSWVTGDRIGLGLKQGVLVSTRGLGQDLMAADVSGLLGALRAGRGQTIRIHDYLDGENQIHRSRFQCDVQLVGREVLSIYGLKVATKHMIESCQNPDYSFQNHYWISAGGKIWQSRQWVGPALKYVFVQQLSR